VTLEQSGHTLVPKSCPFLISAVLIVRIDSSIPPEECCPPSGKRPKYCVTGKKLKAGESGARRAERPTVPDACGPAACGVVAMSVRVDPDGSSTNGALPCVTANVLCPGCGNPFTPAHWRQVHCRPSCRVLALRKRREPAPALFTAAADAIEPAVFDN